MPSLKTPNNAAKTLLLLIGIIPALAFIEKDNKPALTAVVTSIEIKADPQTIWENVVEFPQLGKPTEFIFKTGIAYPTDAKFKAQVLAQFDIVTSPPEVLLSP